MFLTALALHAAVQAERWVNVGGSEGSHREYLDTQSIKRTGEKVTLWTRRDLVQGQAIEHGGLCDMSSNDGVASGAILHPCTPHYQSS